MLVFLTAKSQPLFSKYCSGRPHPESPQYFLSDKSSPTTIPPSAHKSDLLHVLKAMWRPKLFRRRRRLKDSQIAQNSCAEFEEIAEICESYQPILVRQTHSDKDDDDDNPVTFRNLHAATLSAVHRSDSPAPPPPTGDNAYKSYPCGFRSPRYPKSAV